LLVLQRTKDIIILFSILSSAKAMADSASSAKADDKEKESKAEGGDDSRQETTAGGANADQSRSGRAPLSSLTSSPPRGKPKHKSDRNGGSLGTNARLATSHEERKEKTQPTPTAAPPQAEQGDEASDDGDEFLRDMRVARSMSKLAVLNRNRASLHFPLWPEDADEVLEHALTCDENVFSNSFTTTEWTELELSRKRGKALEEKRRRRSDEDINDGPNKSRRTSSRSRSPPRRSRSPHHDHSSDDENDERKDERRSDSPTRDDGEVDRESNDSQKKVSAPLKLEYARLMPPNWSGPRPALTKETATQKETREKEAKDWKDVPLYASATERRKVLRDNAFALPSTKGTVTKAGVKMPATVDPSKDLDEKKVNKKTDLPTKHLYQVLTKDWPKLISNNADLLRVVLTAANTWESRSHDETLQFLVKVMVPLIIDNGRMATDAMTRATIKLAYPELGKIPEANAAPSTSIAQTPLILQAVEEARERGDLEKALKKATSGSRSGGGGNSASSRGRAFRGSSKGTRSKFEPKGGSFRDSYRSNGTRPSSSRGGSSNKFGKSGDRGRGSSSSSSSSDPKKRS
jgi:hypothetical protein